MALVPCLVSGGVGQLARCPKLAHQLVKLFAALSMAEIHLSILTHEAVHGVVHCSHERDTLGTAVEDLLCSFEVSDVLKYAGVMWCDVLCFAFRLQIDRGISRRQEGPQ